MQFYNSRPIILHEVGYSVFTSLLSVGNGARLRLTRFSYNETRIVAAALLRTTDVVGRPASGTALDGAVAVRPGV